MRRMSVHQERGALRGCSAGAWGAQPPTSRNSPGAGGWGAARSARSSGVRAGTQASRAGERQRPRAAEPRSGHVPDERASSAREAQGLQRGGVGGAAHHIKKQSGAGGWEAARSARSSGVRAGTQASGAGERQRPRAAEPRSGHVPDERASSAREAQGLQRGGVGGAAHHIKKQSGGGRVGSGAQRTLLRRPRRYASLEGRRASAPSRCRAAAFRPWRRPSRRGQRRPASRPRRSAGTAR